jgi:5-methylcytosine-specific restriction endonuclease McrA
MESKKQIEKAWEDSRKIRGKNSDQYRRDPYGNEIFKSSYGKQGEKSWELDHIKPKSKKGSDNPRNIQAVQWEENRKKSDTYPYKKK